MILSIITPVLNGERFIRKNIESIQNLKVPHEHIIVEGGSSDSTVEILQDYPHLKIINQNERNGMYGAIAQGFSEAHGDLITWINCDDYINTEEYEKMVRKMMEVGVDVIYSDAYFDYINEERREIIKANRFPNYFLRRGYLPFVQPTSIYRKKFYDKIGGLNIEFKIAGDLELFVRMGQDNDSRFYKYDGVTVHFIKYGESLGDRNVEKYLAEKEKIQTKQSSFITRALFKITKI